MTLQIVSINVATEEVDATFEATSARHVGRALGFASAAAQTWRALPLGEPAESLFGLRANRRRLARHTAIAAVSESWGAVISVRTPRPKAQARTTTSIT
jgi:acyl-CoA reductase-like NAD-dependent aldehyde dehydrogenase